MPSRLALSPGRFDKIGAGLEPKKRSGKPFRQDPAATEIRFQSKVPYIVVTHPKGRTTINSFHEKENTVDPKEKQVLEAMKKQGKPVRPGDIAKITQLDGKEVSTIIKNLKKQGKIVSPKQCFYEPV